MESGGAIETPWYEETLDVECFLSTPIDGGLPMSPPSPPSAEAGEQELELPDLTCTPTTTDVELVRDYLCPAIRRMRDLGRARVSTDLPRVGPCELDPCELPGMIARNNKGRRGGIMRDKYYLTDHTTVANMRMIALRGGVRTTSGIWQKNAHDTVIRAEHKRMVGVKRTMRFYQYPGAKTNWIMNIYYSCNEGNSFLQDGLVLCHVFETDSPDYDDNPKCLGCHRGACSGHHHDQEFRAPSQGNSFNSTQSGYWPTNCYPSRHSDPRLMSYIEQLGNLLFSDSDPDNSADTGNSGATRGEPPMADHGQSKKRKKISDVWDYFTKIFARDINGKVMTYAACNHCCKILSASSKNGTSQLARHACPCKFKPVAAGRSAKDSGGDVNVLSS